MRRTIKERQAEIKGMTTAELRRRYNEGRFGELRPFAEAELVERETENEEERLTRSEARSEEALSISRRANTTAISAIICSAIATIIAAVISVVWGK